MKPPIDTPKWAIFATYHSEEEEEPSGSNNNNGGGSNGGSNSGSNNNGNGRTSISGYTSDENYDKLCDDRNDNSEAAQKNNEAKIIPRAVPGLAFLHKAVIFHNELNSLFKQTFNF
ncbi:hypothetical protein C2G38_2217922 [Gigaspora rosea]|uniref:Uncharacterized protein n=1 Tax=Gigaspora rosea TaxID=44941 RepID=A0A397U798_9GLOM|nr:hypothetical protein C2G38_2217922 [Gigaspora rosea]